MEHGSRACVAALAFDADSRQQLALDAIDAGSFDWDLARGQVTWDAKLRELLGVPLDQPADPWTWLARVHPDEADALSAGLARFLSDGRVAPRFSLRHRVRRPEGGWRWLEVSGRSLHAGAGAARRCMRLAGLVVDDGARAEDERRKDEFLATLAHELRNPLAPVSNAARLLAREPALTGTGRRAVEMVDRQVRQLQRLVDDLLEVNRMVRGQIVLRLEPVALDHLLAAALEAAQPAAEAKGQSLRADLPGRLPALVADPVRLAQVLENLLSNAIKYSPVGGAIRVSVRAGAVAAGAVAAGTLAGAVADPAAAVEIAVADDGIGIEADQRERIFDAFAQAHPSVGPHQGGLGIGLALVKRLVEMHGGRVRADSDGPGRGSVFTVRLPVARDAARPPQARPQSPGR